MISGGRIVKIFRTRGRSGPFTKLAEEFSANQLATVLAELANEPPLVVSIRSNNEWFAITKWHLWSRNSRTKQKVALTELIQVDCDARRLAEGKSKGGKLSVFLHNGSVVAMDVESGRPYVALLNVFLYIAKMNQRAGNKPLVNSGKGWPTTNDKRPTTQL